MRYDYDADIKDAETGVYLLQIIDVELEISLDTDGRTPIVDAVWLNGQSLMQLLGHRIEQIASGELLAEGRLYQKVMEQEGVHAERAAHRLVTRMAF